MGHTRRYCKAVFLSQKDLAGQIVEALAEKESEDGLLLCKLI